MSQNQKKEFKLNYGGKEIIIETGRLAKQADGAVLVSCGGTQVLATVCSAYELKDGQDFFPLLVEYTEKFYAAGKFLGGFLKREGRPTTQETLTSRLIDRPLRPLFPEGYMFDTVVTCTVLSYGPEGDPEVLASLGAAAALAVSNVPFSGPLGACKVGRINGQFVLNPALSQWEQSDLELMIAASADAILMVEGEAQVVPEKDILAAIKFGHQHIKEFVQFLGQIQSTVGSPKRQFVSAAANSTLVEQVTTEFSGQARLALGINEKLIRASAIRELVGKVAAQIKSAPERFGLAAHDSSSKEAFKAVDSLLYNMMRADILNEEKRIGGRRLDQIRPITSEVNVLHSPHGSALFTRGETQVLATVTVGGSNGEQMSDRITGLAYSKFYLHYNFPPFSVAEAKGNRGAGRREMGHGNLAERALKAVIPQQDYNYTTRVVCEVLESNGSSSMASVCAGTMALMDAGVPIKAPVAGIAMGLVTDGSRFKVLTDILGDEDHLGDMDFKLAGTSTGVTAIQMDIKIAGLTEEIIATALEQARVGRMFILGEMAKCITVSRQEYKEGVPLIKSFKIRPDQIGALIGPGGKNIKAIQEEFQVTLECEEDGTIKVLGKDRLVIDQCINSVSLQINGPELGKDYLAKVVSIKEYGAFVDIVPGLSGLVHVSELADERVKDVNDYIAEGDQIKVRVIEIDKMGRLKLSAKAAGQIARKGER